MTGPATTAARPATESPLHSILTGMPPPGSRGRPVPLHHSRDDPAGSSSGFSQLDIHDLADQRNAAQDYYLSGEADLMASVVSGAPETSMPTADPAAVGNPQRHLIVLNAQLKADLHARHVPDLRQYPVSLLLPDHAYKYPRLGANGKVIPWTVMGPEENYLDQLDSPTSQPHRKSVRSTLPESELPQIRRPSRLDSADQHRTKALWERRKMEWSHLDKRFLAMRNQPSESRYDIRSSDEAIRDGGGHDASRNGRPNNAPAPLATMGSGPRAAPSRLPAVSRTKSLKVAASPSVMMRSRPDFKATLHRQHPQVDEAAKSDTAFWKLGEWVGNDYYGVMSTVGHKPQSQPASTSQRGPPRLTHGDLLRHPETETEDGEGDGDSDSDDEDSGRYYDGDYMRQLRHQKKCIATRELLDLQDPVNAATYRRESQSASTQASRASGRSGRSGRSGNSYSARSSHSSGRRGDHYYDSDGNDEDDATMNRLRDRRGSTSSTTSLNAALRAPPPVGLAAPLSPGQPVASNAEAEFLSPNRITVKGKLHDTTEIMFHIQNKTTRWQTATCTPLAREFRDSRVNIFYCAQMVQSIQPSSTGNIRFIIQCRIPGVHIYRVRFDVAPAGITTTATLKLVVIKSVASAKAYRVLDRTIFRRHGQLVVAEILDRLLSDITSAPPVRKPRTLAMMMETFRQLNTDYDPPNNEATLQQFIDLARAVWSVALVDPAHEWSLSLKELYETITQLPDAALRARHLETYHRVLTSHPTSTAALYATLPAHQQRRDLTAVLLRQLLHEFSRNALTLRMTLGLPIDRPAARFRPASHTAGAAAIASGSAGRRASVIRSPRPPSGVPAPAGSVSGGSGGAGAHLAVGQASALDARAPSTATRPASSAVGM
ncbi:hypothetical protein CAUPRSCDRAFT_10732, partial [Caulochytrium protostelioides]